MNSKLREIQLAAGAVFASSDAPETVRSYGDPVMENSAVRNRAGLIDQSHRGKLRLKGKDRVDFLHGMTTNDIKKLTPGNGLYTTFTTDKAKMLADGRVYFLPDALWIDVEPGVTDKLQKHLDKFTLVSDVAIENITEAFGLLSIHGPSSQEILPKLVKPESVPAQEYSTVSFTMDGLPILVVRNEITGEAGFDFYIPIEQTAAIWSRLIQVGGPHGLKPVGLDALNSLRIEAGIPVFGIDMDESNFPMEAGLEARAISYTKGCYIGQETIARADAQGRMNKRLIGLELSGESVPKKGEPILAPPQGSGAEPKAVGTVTSAVHSPTLGRVIAMGYVRYDLAKPGCDVVIEETPAKVVSLPFYARSR
jgi:folate-binding protein YgfZ